MEPHPNHILIILRFPDVMMYNCSINDKLILYGYIFAQVCLTFIYCNITIHDEHRSNVEKKINVVERKHAAVHGLVVGINLVCLKVQ